MSSSTDRQRRYRERMKGLGFVQVCVLVPSDRLDEFHEAAARLRSDRIQQVLAEEAAGRD
jgi:hypothetical protein